LNCNLTKFERDHDVHRQYLTKVSNEDNLTDEEWEQRVNEAEVQD